MKPKIFVGSSTPNLNVARAVQDCLIARNFDVRVWDEGQFKQNEATLDGLIRISTEMDFGVFIWGASDLAMIAGQEIPSPRGNVVFETGLFLGALGKDKTFMIVDQTIALKIPSDFNGITRSHYDGSLIGVSDLSAVASACNAIERSINQREVPAHLTRLQGSWKSRFASGPLFNHPIMTDDVEITVGSDGISLTGTSGAISYTGQAQVYGENQIVGKWGHPSNTWMAKGSFVLVVSPTADSMYGYFTSQDANGAPIFDTWAFAKSEGTTEQGVKAKLSQGQEFIRTHTISPST